MTRDEKRLASLQLLRESTAWMVGVQTAIFGLLVTLLEAELIALGSALIKGAVATFAVSIVFAGIVLGAVPWVLTRAPLPDTIRNAPIFDGPVVARFSIGQASAVQFLAFIVGIVLLAAAVVERQLG